MPPEAIKLLVDIRAALSDIKDFTVGMDFALYQLDAKCRAAVERKFEVIGEACTRLRDRFPEIFPLVLSGSQIIGLRNRIIHGYDNVDDAIVWDIVTRKLPLLATEVEALID
jgi:uncharacterized protein with HEPN domain